MADATVSAGYADGLLRLAVAKGADRAAALARAGIDPVELDDRDARLVFTKYIALMRAAKALSGDDALALHYGEINISNVSVVGLIGEACETAAEAFVQLNRYVKLVVDVDTGTADRFQMRQEHGAMWFVDTRNNANAFPELTESAFAQFVCGPRHIGRLPWAQEVQVTHPAPAHAAEYERVLQVPVVFGTEWNAIRVDTTLMMQRVSVLPRYVFGVLIEHAETLLREMATAQTTRGKVESLLMPVLHKGDVGMDAIAEQMALSRQTLFRRLKAEGTTFEKVLDELRHKLALQYLRGKKTSVNQTAYLVGFSDPASFSRAFKRWTGSSPRDLREKDVEDPTSGMRR